MSHCVINILAFLRLESSNLFAFFCNSNFEIPFRQYENSKNYILDKNLYHLDILIFKGQTIYKYNCSCKNTIIKCSNISMK